MRTVTPRNPEYINKKGKSIYNPGLVDCYQKPWYFRNYSGDVEYYGRFCEEGYPDNIQLEFEPLIKLIGKIKNIDPDLKTEILTMIDEMRDAHYTEWRKHMQNLPSFD